MAARTPQASLAPVHVSSEHAVARADSRDRVAAAVGDPDVGPVEAACLGERPDRGQPEHGLRSAASRTGPRRPGGCRAWRRRPRVRERNAAIWRRETSPSGSIGSRRRPGRDPQVEDFRGRTDRNRRWRWFGEGTANAQRAVQKLRRKSASGCEKGRIERRRKAGRGMEPLGRRPSWHSRRRSEAGVSARPGRRGPAWKSRRSTVESDRTTRDGRSARCGMSQSASGISQRSFSEVIQSMPVEARDVEGARGSAAASFRRAGWKHDSEVGEHEALDGGVDRFPEPQARVVGSRDRPHSGRSAGRPPARDRRPARPPGRGSGRVSPGRSGPRPQERSSMHCTRRSRRTRRADRHPSPFTCRSPARREISGSARRASGSRGTTTPRRQSEAWESGASRT